MLTVRTFSFNPVSENTYVLYNEEKQALIIDPGCYWDEEKQKLETFIKSHQLQPVQLLNTHCHLDHIFGNKWTYEKYALELFMHANEEQVLQAGPQTGKSWGMPFENYDGPLHFLDEHDRVTLDQDVLTVLLTPGHSPGSICFYCESQRFVIGGDVLFKESIGRTDLPGGNHSTLLESIRQQLFVLPDDVVIYPGHGDPTTIGYEKRFNPYLRG